MYPKLNPARLYACIERPQIDDAILRNLYELPADQHLSYDYDTDGLFSQQFDQLYGILIAMIHAEDSTEEVPEYAAIAEHFLSEQLHAAFVNLKRMMEKTVFYLQQLSSNQGDENSQESKKHERAIKKKRAYLGRIAADLKVCGPGIFANFQQVVAELETRETLVDWLVRIRGEVFERLCRHYCDRKGVSRIMEVHAGVTLRNYACEKGWSIHGDNIPNSDDPYAEYIADGDKGWVEEEFTQNYNFQDIWSWVSWHVLFNINDLIKTNLHITDRGDFDHKAGLFLHEVGINSAEAFGFVGGCITLFRQEMIPLLVCKGLLDYFDVDDKVLKDCVTRICEDMREFLRSWPNHDECAPLFVAIATTVSEISASGYVEIANGLFDGLFKAGQWSRDFGKNVVAMLSSRDKKQRDVALNYIEKFVLNAGSETRAAIADSLVTYFTPDNARSNGNASLSALQSLMEREDECRTIFAPMLLWLCIESESPSRNKSAQAVIKQYEKSNNESERVIISQVIQLCAESHIGKAREWALSKAVDLVPVREVTVQDTASKVMSLCAISDSEFARDIASNMILYYAREKSTALKAINEIYSLALVSDDKARDSVARAICACATSRKDRAKGVATTALKKCLISQQKGALNAVPHVIKHAGEHNYGGVLGVVTDLIRGCIEGGEGNTQNIAALVIKCSEYSLPRYGVLVERAIVPFNILSSINLMEDREKALQIRDYLVSLVVEYAKIGGHAEGAFVGRLGIIDIDRDDMSREVTAMVLRDCIVSGDDNARTFASERFKKMCCSEANNISKLLHYYSSSKSDQRSYVCAEAIRILAEVGYVSSKCAVAEFIVECLRSESADLQEVAADSIADLVSSDEITKAETCAQVIVELLIFNQEESISAAIDIILDNTNAISRGIVENRLALWVEQSAEQNILSLIKAVMHRAVFQAEHLDLVVKLIVFCAKCNKRDIAKGVIEECVNADNVMAIKIIKGLLANGESVVKRDGELVCIDVLQDDEVFLGPNDRMREFIEFDASVDMLRQWLKLWLVSDEDKLQQFAKEMLKQLIRSANSQYLRCFSVNFVKDLVLSASQNMMNLALGLIACSREAECRDARYEMLELAINLFSHGGEDFDAYAAVSKIIESPTEPVDMVAVDALDGLIELCLNLRTAEQLQRYIDEMLPIITLQFAESPDSLLRSAAEKGICALRSVDDVYKSVLIRCVESGTYSAQDMAWDEMLVWWNKEISIEVKRAVVGRCCESQDPGVQNKIIDAMRRWAQVDNDDVRSFVVSVLMDCLCSNNKGVQNIAINLVAELSILDNREVKAALKALFDGCDRAREDKLIAAAVPLLKKCAESGDAQAERLASSVIRRLSDVDGRISPIAEKAIFQCARSESDSARNVIVNSMLKLAVRGDASVRKRVIEIISKLFRQVNKDARATALEAVVACVTSNDIDAIAVASEVMLTELLAVDDEDNHYMQYVLLACMRSDYESARDVALTFLCNFLELHAQDLCARKFATDVIFENIKIANNSVAKTFNTILKSCPDIKQSRNKVSVVVGAFIKCWWAGDHQVRGYIKDELVEYADSGDSIKEHVLRELIITVVCGSDLSLYAIKDVICECVDDDSRPLARMFIVGLFSELMTLTRQQKANGSGFTTTGYALKLMEFCVLSSSEVLQEAGRSAFLDNAKQSNNRMVANFLLSRLTFRILPHNDVVAGGPSHVDVAKRLVTSCVATDNSCAIRMASDVMLELFDSTIPAARTSVADILIDCATAESPKIRAWGSDILQRGLSLSGDNASKAAQEIVNKFARNNDLCGFIVAAIYESFDPFVVNIKESVFLGLVCQCAESEDDMVRGVGFNVIDKLIDDKLRTNHIESMISNICERCICSANIATQDFARDRLIYAASLRDTYNRDLVVSMMVEWLCSSKDNVRERALQLIFDCVANDNNSVHDAAVCAIASAALRDRRDDLITICARYDSGLVRGAVFSVIEELLNPHDDFTMDYAPRVKTVIVKAISLFAESEDSHEQAISLAMLDLCNHTTSRLGINVTIEAAAQCATSEKASAQNIARNMLQRCFAINDDAVAIRKGEEVLRRLDLSGPFSSHKDIAQYGFSLRARAMVQRAEADRGGLAEVCALLEQYIDSGDDVQIAIAQEALLFCTIAHPLSEDCAATRIVNYLIARIDSEKFLFALIKQCVQSRNPNAQEFACNEFVKLAGGISDCQITEKNLVASRFVNYFIALGSQYYLSFVGRILDCCLSAEGLEGIVEKNQQYQARTFAQKGLRNLVFSSKNDEQRVALRVLQKNLMSQDLAARNSVNYILKESLKSGLDDVAGLVIAVVQSALADEERGKAIVLSMLMEWAKSPEQETNEAALSVLSKLSESSAAITAEIVKTCASSADVALTQFVSKLFEQWLLSNNSNMQLLLSTNLVNCIVNRDPKELEVVSAFFVQQISLGNLQVCGKVLAVVTKQCAKRDLHPLFELMLRKADRITDEKIRGCLGDIQDLDDSKFIGIYAKPISDLFVHTMNIQRESAREYQRPRLFSPSRHAPIVAERADALALFGALFKDDANAVATILRRQSFKKGRLKEIADYFKQPLVQDRMFSSLP